LYIIALNHLVKMIARNKGTLINIDTSQNDVEFSKSRDVEEALEIRLKYMDIGYNIFNSTKNGEDSALGMARPAPTIDNADTTSAILNVLNLLEWLNAETAMIIGVSPQRMSQMVSDRVSDNQQALIQSSYITEPYFYGHNETWKEVNLEYLRIFIIWMKEWFYNNPTKKEFFLNYNFSQASMATAKITPNVLDESDYGIRMMLAGNAKEYFDTMKQMALTFAQNEQMTIIDMSSILLDSLGGASPHEVDFKLKEATAKRDKQRQEMEQQQQKSQEDMQAKQLEMQKHLEDRQDQRDQKMHDWKMEEIAAQGDINKEIKAMDVYGYAQDLDVNDNDIPDPIEAEKLMHQTNVDRAKLGMEQTKLGLEDRKLKLAEESEAHEMVKHNDNKKLKEKEIQVKKQTANKKTTK